jgi:[glutamine synthetase] adenylyltransferase / [glutamine synthetase]-adenylyl-L-tyrosine phosphorylase
MPASPHHPAVDWERARHYVAEYGRLSGRSLTELQADEDCYCRLLTVFSFSHFLSKELLRHPEWLGTVSELHRPYSAEDYKRRLAEFVKERRVTVASAAAELALFRRRELLRIVIRDALGLGTLAEITEELSNLADAVLAYALSLVTSDLAGRYGRPLLHDTSRENQPAVFTILALGKLGGRELNYSSDIDLLFLYTGHGETSGPEQISNKEFFKKVSNRLTGLLSAYTSAGVTYRVDLRLRPEGSLGEVCISLDGAREYYSKRARDWELQMLIKARVAAGDEALGQALLDFVEPSIYSTTLDFSTIETMSATRERISDKLNSKRLSKDVIDIKLARGGIRDIEFLVQCLQRLHGGRETYVRHAGTLLALSRLLARDLLSPTEHLRLVSAYEFLRHLEHRLQFEEDRQTHALPLNPEQLERVARRMPGPRSNGLLQELNNHLENVQVIYDRIVHAQRPLYYSPRPPSRVPMSEAPSVESREPSLGGVSEELLQLLDYAAPVLAASVRTHGIRRNERRLSYFLRSLLDDPSWLQLLNSNSVVADYTLQIFELSPFLSEQLTRDPKLLEEIRRIAEHPTRRWAFEGLAAPLNDVPALRRFFSREMFRIQAGSICLNEPVFQTLDRTSALAEFLIARAYRISVEQAIAHARSHATPDKPFVEPQNELMVVALGRLGMREFDLDSDSDLLFIIPDTEGVRQQFWTRVAEHLIEILTAYTGDGATLTLDTRLRPNGREGPLVQTESKYVDYFATRAEAWEGIAYMKARAIAGDIERATTFLSELQQVDWRRYGQSGRSKQDLRQMRMRLQREGGTANPLKAGFGGYYDADFILMYLRLKGAGMFFKSLNTPERIDIVEKMGHLERADAEFLLRATTFFRALDHGLRIVTGRSGQGLPSTPAELEMLVELLGRWTGDRKSTSALEEELLSIQTGMRRLFDSIFVN